jgi:hypothetical protein
MRAGRDRSGTSNVGARPAPLLPRASARCATSTGAALRRGGVCDGATFALRIAIVSTRPPGHRRPATTSATPATKRAALRLLGGRVDNIVCNRTVRCLCLTSRQSAATPLREASHPHRSPSAVVTRLLQMACKLALGRQSPICRSVHEQGCSALALPRAEPRSAGWTQGMRCIRRPIQEPARQSVSRSPVAHRRRAGCLRSARVTRLNQNQLQMAP